MYLWSNTLGHHLIEQASAMRFKGGHRPTRDRLGHAGTRQWHRL